LVFGTAYAVALLRVLRTFWVQALPEVDGGFVQSWRFEVDSGQGTVDSAEIPTPLACFITHSDRLGMS
jgi:hypothetical protein